MRSQDESRGQAAVELVGLLPLLVALTLAGWIAVRTAAELERAAGAARAATRAEQVGAPAAGAARVLAPGARVRRAPGGRTTVRTDLRSPIGDLPIEAASGVVP